MFRRFFGQSSDEDSNTHSEEAQIIFDMYTAFEDIRFSRTDAARELDAYKSGRKLVEAAERLLAENTSEEFFDIRSDVARVAALKYQEHGILHSKRYRTDSPHTNNLQAITDFSRAIELYKLAEKEVDPRAIELFGLAEEEVNPTLHKYRGYCYLST